MKGVKRSYLEHNLVGGIPWFVMKVIYRIGDLCARTDDRSGLIAKIIRGRCLGWMGSLLEDCDGFSPTVQHVVMHIIQ